MFVIFDEDNNNIDDVEKDIQMKIQSYLDKTKKVFIINNNGLNPLLLINIILIMLHIQYGEQYLI